MFIPYRCFDCIHGSLLPYDNDYDCDIGVSDDEECMENHNYTCEPYTRRYRKNTEKGEPDSALSKLSHTDSIQR